MSTLYKIKTEERSRLYYDKWTYKFHFKQEELNIIRGEPTDADIDRIVAMRKSWESSREMAQSKDSVYTPELIDNLKKTNHLLHNTKYPFKKVHCYNYVYLYTNDVELIDLIIAELPHIQVVPTVQKSNPVLPKDVILVKKPGAKYRTYFRERRIDEKIRLALADWVRGQDGEVVCSPATLQWLNDTPSRLFWGRNGWCRRWFYIEHNSLQYETMLGMIVPGVVRKTVPIECKDK